MVLDGVYGIMNLQSPMTPTAAGLLWSRSFEQEEQGPNDPMQCTTVQPLPQGMLHDAPSDIDFAVPLCILHTPSEPGPLRFRKASGLPKRAGRDEAREAQQTLSIPVPPMLRNCTPISPGSAVNMVRTLRRAPDLNEPPCKAIFRQQSA